MAWRFSGCSCWCWTVVMLLAVASGSNPPLFVSFSPSTVKENIAAGQLVTTMSTFDFDSGNTHSYQLLSQLSFFTVAGNRLLATTTALDYERENTMYLIVRSTDNTGLSRDFQVPLQISDTNDAPSDLTLLQTTLDGTLRKVGDTITTFQVKDQDNLRDRPWTATRALQSHIIALCASSTLGWLAMQSNALVLTHSIPDTVGDSLDLCFQVTDSGSPASQATFLRTLQVIVVRGVAPGLLFPALVEVLEASSTEVPVAVLEAFDADEKGTLLFGLEDATGTFRLGEASSCRTATAADASRLQANLTGWRRCEIPLLLNRSLDFEQARAYTLNITVTDTDSLQLTASLSVAVVDQNEAPSDLLLSALDVQENTAPGTYVATVFGLDPDAPEAFRDNAIRLVEVVAATSSTPCPAFSLAGNELVVNSRTCLDHEVEATLAVTLEAQDKAEPSLRLRKTFLLAVRDINEAPQNLSLSATSLWEDAGKGHPVGNFSAVDPDNFGSQSPGPQSLACRLLDADSSFAVAAGLQLQLARADLDFERQESYRVQVTCTDSGSPPLSVTGEFHLQVLNANEPPEAVLLSAFTVPEDAPIGTVVGQLTAIDPDNSGLGTDHFSFCLWTPEQPCWPGAAPANESQPNPVGTAASLASDAAFFSISPRFQLVTARALNFEAQARYRLHLAARDSGNLSVVTPVEILVLDRNDPPANLRLSSSAVLENQAGAVIGTLAADDEDASQSLSFQVVPAFGTDHSLVTIEGGTVLRLRPVVAADYELQVRLRITVRATDSGLPVARFLEATFTIDVLNLNEDPLAVTLAPLGSTVGRQALFAVPEAAGGSSDPTVFPLAQVLVVDPDNTLYEPQLQSHRCALEGVSPAEPALALIAATNVLQWLPAQAALDYERVAQYNLSVRCVDSGQPPRAFQGQLRLEVTNRNEAPTQLRLNGQNAAGLRLQLRESPHPFLPLALGQLEVADPDNCAAPRCQPHQKHTIALLEPRGLLGVSSAGDELLLFQRLDYEQLASPLVQVTLQVQDDGEPPEQLQVQLTLEVLDQNEAIAGAALVPTAAAESAGPWLATLHVTDPDLPTSLNGQHTVRVLSPSFLEAVGTNLSLARGAELNFEALPAFQILVEVSDLGTPPTTLTASFNFAVLDVDEPPAVALAPTRREVEENQAPLLLAQVEVVEPDHGEAASCAVRHAWPLQFTPTVACLHLQDPIMLSGALELRNLSLWLVAPLDYECVQALAVTVECFGVNQRTGRRSPLVAAANLTVSVSNVVEPPSALALISKDSRVQVLDAGRIQVPELTPPGMILAELACTTELGRSCSWALISTRVEPAVAAVVAPGNVLALVLALDFEVQASYNLTVRARDQALPQVFADFAVQLLVKDVNEAPVGITAACGCGNVPCLNNGVCRANGLGFTCVCAFGFTGLRCEQRTGEPRLPLPPALGSEPCLRFAPGLPLGSALFQLQARDPDRNDEHFFMLDRRSEGQGLAINAGVVQVTGPLLKARIDLTVLVSDRGNHQIAQTFALLASPCAARSCQSDSTCHVEADGQSTSCVCNTGFVTSADGLSCAPRVCLHAVPGTACTETTDTCLSEQCQNGASCVPGMTASGAPTFACRCAPGFEGVRCEIALNACQPAPCFAGGQCVDAEREDNFRCACSATRHGRQCQLHATGCDGLVPGGCSRLAVCLPAVHGQDGAVQWREQCVAKASVFAMAFRASTGACGHLLPNECVGVWNASMDDFEHFLLLACGAGSQIIPLGDVANNQAETLASAVVLGSSGVVLDPTRVQAAITAACSRGDMIPARLLGFCGGRFSAVPGDEGSSNATALPTFLPPVSTAEPSNGPLLPSPANTSEGSSATVGISVAAVLLLLLLILGLVLRRQGSSTPVVEFDRPAVAFENKVATADVDALLGARHAWAALDTDGGKAQQVSSVGVGSPQADLQAGAQGVKGAGGDEVLVAEELDSDDEDVGYIQVTELGEDGTKTVRTMRRSVDARQRSRLDPVFVNPLYTTPSSTNP